MPGTEEDTFTCSVCHDTVEGELVGLIHDNASRPFCEDCSGDTVHTCHECEEYIDIEAESYCDYGGNTICESCRDEHYFICEHCDAVEHNNNLHSPESSDSYLCEYCYGELPSCYGCNEAVFETHEVEGDEYCTGCARDKAEELMVEIRDREYGDDEFDEDDDEDTLSSLIELAIPINLFGVRTREWSCSQCDRISRGRLPHSGTWDLAFFITQGLIAGRCRECSGVGQTRRPRTGTTYQVMSYSHKPTPEFKRTERDLARRALHFGTEVELEMSGGRGDDRGVALDLIGEADQGHRLFYCKADACIGNGFEIVSHPFTYDWMNHNKDAFDAMFKLAKVMKGFESVKCGMHIHMSANAFTDLHLFKFMRWFYRNRKFVRSLSRRPRGRLDSWASMKEPDDKKLLEYALDKTKGLGLGRAALNLGDRTTVECRIFRSTLSPTGYYGNIEFLQSLFDFTKNSGVKDTSYTSYMKFVQARGKSYKNFLNLTETIRPVMEVEGE